MTLYLSLPRLLCIPGLHHQSIVNPGEINNPPTLVVPNSKLAKKFADMQSPMLYQSSGEGYPWTSRRLGLKLHVMVVLCVVLNLVIAALVILIQEKKIYITDKPVYGTNGGQSTYYWKSLLPAIGGIIGNMNSYITGGGIALLVSTYAKHLGFHKGLNLQKIRHLSMLGELRSQKMSVRYVNNPSCPAASGVPVGVTPLMIIGLLLTVSMSLTGAVCLSRPGPSRACLTRLPSSCPHLILYRASSRPLHLLQSSTILQDHGQLFLSRRSQTQTYNAATKEGSKGSSSPWYSLKECPAEWNNPLSYRQLWIWAELSCER
jgi:hypothetical protein